ncbi:MAG: hypothetical protein NTW15_22705 [Burkholderiales bacterium]|nr:hypothetical protein [Burkholderiales bacterium]
MIAQHGTVDHIEAVVRGFLRAQQAAALSREASQHAGRTLRWHHDEDGSLVGGERQQPVVHEGDAMVRLRDDGAVAFTDALGRCIEAAPPTAGSSDWIAATHRREGPATDPHTAVGHWRGERLELGPAVAGLCAEDRGGGGGAPRAPV